jgi:replicative DNA helicase
MSPAELLRRHTARATSTFLGRLKSGEMNVEAIEALTLRALADAPDLALLDATRAPASPARIYEAALIAKGENASVLVVIDSLQSWAEGMGEMKDGDGKPLLINAGEYETLNAGIKSLRWLSHALKCPIMFISERNRESNKGGAGGGLNAGAGTRKIEYGAETIFDLDRKMDEAESGAGEFDITLRLAKNRHGSIGKPIKLQFNGALQRFKEAEKAENGSGYRR